MYVCIYIYIHIYMQVSTKPTRLQLPNITCPANQATIDQDAKQSKLIALWTALHFKHLRLANLASRPVKILNSPLATNFTLHNNYTANF